MTSLKGRMGHKTAINDAHKDRPKFSVEELEEIQILETERSKQRHEEIQRWLDDYGF